MKRKIFTYCFVFLIVLSFHALAAETEPVEEWVKRYNSANYAFANALAVDSLDNVYVTGGTSNVYVRVYDYSNELYFGDYAYIIIKYRQMPSTPAEVINVIENMLTSGEITSTSTAVANAIVSQLSNAQNNITINPTSATNMISAVINFIEAQSGKKITTESAETLIKYLTDIIAGL